MLRDVAQLVARMVWDHDAVGSNPIISTTKKTYSFEWVFFVVDDDSTYLQFAIELGAQNRSKAW